MTLHKALISRIAAVAMGLALAAPGMAFADEGRADVPAAPETTQGTLLNGASPLLVAQADTQPQDNQQQGGQQQGDQQFVSDWSLNFDPAVPWPLIGGLAGLMAVMAAVGATGRLHRNWLWATAGGTLILTLATPQILEEVRAPLPTSVVLVTDGSASQGIGNRAALTAEAVEALRAQLENIPGVEIRIVEGGHQGLEDGTGTRLFGPAAEGLADIAPDRLGAVILLTDGQVHDLNKAGLILSGQSPLHALISGSANETDRRIQIENAPAYGLVDEEQTIRYRVYDDTAAGENGPVQVTITIDGQDSFTQSVTPGELQEVNVPVTHAGNNYIALEVAPVEGELTPANNRAVADIEGVREQMRVLLVSGEPTLGSRAWRTTLKDDPAVDLIHISVLQTPQNYDATPLHEKALTAIPSRELFMERLQDFDLIVFDHVDSASQIPARYMENVADYVENGGAVLMASGAEYGSESSLYNTPLQRVLPVAPAGPLVEQPFRPEIDGDGLRHPVTRGMLDENGETPAWGQWFRVVDSDPAVNGHTLMQGANDEPLLVLSRQGEGRVAMLMSDDAWLWQRGYDGGGPYATLMQRMAHWLLKEPALEEEALRLSANSEGELTIERQTMEDEATTVTLESPSGVEQQVELTETVPGLWRATVTVDEQGLYKATQGELSTLTNVGPANPDEFVDTHSTLERLAPLTAETQGGIARMADDGRNLSLPSIRPVYEAAAGDAMAGDGWFGIRMSNASDLVATRSTNLLDGWIGYTLAFGMMAAAFVLSGRQGSRRQKGQQNKPGNNGPQPN